MDIHDQNVLNALFFRDVKYVDSFKYNCLIKNFTYIEGIFNSCIIFHFAGIKPWDKDYPSEICKKIWLKYANRLK